METGTRISLGAHGALIALAVFGGHLFDADASQEIRISEVSIISTEAFNGLMSSAPNRNIDEPQQVKPTQPFSVMDAPVAIESSKQSIEEPLEPEVLEVVEPEPAPQVKTEPAEPVEIDTQEALVEPEVTGNEVVTSDALSSDQDQSGQMDAERLEVLRPKPRPAPRISDEIVEKPETDVERSDMEMQTTERSEEPAEKIPEDTRNTAKDESTTEIVTEADEVDPNLIAPIKSARPKRRPANVVQKASVFKKAAEKAKADKIAVDNAAKKIAKEKARKKVEAEEIKKALNAVQEETSKPSGPPLTGREKGALVLAVQKCWTPPIGVQNARDLKVTLLVELNEQGKITGGPTLVSPSGSLKGVLKQAFEAGRRALLRCGPYDLPKDKYEQWKDIEVTFNPQNLVMR